ncbi:hypothetical protein ACNHYB_08980 [Isoptericola jiangsuensis]|uniref:hypothetical protein n=1 Tax=Isoptericola jiangsuensis TaxID=548579 RepID=UPI003AB0D827
MDDVGRDAEHDGTGRDGTGRHSTGPDAPAQDGRHGLPATHEAGVDPHLAQFSGVVGEVDDPLTWGLDLEDETLTGHDEGDDPEADRFVRSYRTFAGESFEIETLRAPVDDDDVEDVVRAAASSALVAPLHADIAAPVEPDAEPVPRPAADFADDYADYRSAMRAIVREVDTVPLCPGTLRVDGRERPAVLVRVRDVVAVHVALHERALVVTGPADLVDKVDVVTGPIRSLLQQPPERR